ADFLATWISPVEFARDYASRRRSPEMSRHVQFEGRMSVTGSKADRRVRSSPEEIRGHLAHMAAQLQAGQAVDLAGDLPRGRSLVVCGLNDLHTQVLVNHINHLLGNYGATLDIERPS